mmetsp:Transcript_6721/g.7598  ORF Transcript_6721/g.7598 Transcript_6721/m.7598 type:complete len:190 (+) Transcript_6721:107-676(+)
MAAQVEAEDTLVPTADDTPNDTPNVFHRCDPDPKGSVSRAWSLSLLFILVFFGLAIFETVSLSQNAASWAFIFAAGWTAFIQIAMAITGTFIIKRFATPFSIGFLLGLVIIVAQQNLLLCVNFYHTKNGDIAANIVFSNLAFTLFVVYSAFAVMLYNYRNAIMVAPIDAKGFGKGRKKDKTGITSEEEA